MKRGLIVMGFLLLALIGAAGCLREGSVGIAGISIARESVTSGEVVLNVSVTIQHYSGPGIGDTKIRLQARDSSTGLVVAEVIQPVGPIGVGGTRICHTLITLPRSGSYEILVNVFDGDHLLASGKIPVYNLDRLPTDKSRTALSVTDMDFIVRSVSGNTARVEADIYFTNRGSEPSPPLSVEIKAREEDARLTADRQWTTVDPVQPDMTVIANVTLAVPDQYNYEVPVVLWREGVIVGEATGYIRLRPVTMAAKDQQFVTRDIETGSFVPEEGRLAVAIPPGIDSTMRSPGFELPIVAGAFLILAVFARRKRYE